MKIIRIFAVFASLLIILVLIILNNSVRIAKAAEPCAPGECTGAWRVCGRNDDYCCIGHGCPSGWCSTVGGIYCGYWCVGSSCIQKCCEGANCSDPWLHCGYSFDVVSECTPCDGVAPCSCTSWANGECGGGTCAVDQRHQTRSCEDDCSNESRCIADAACEFNCTIDLLPDTLTIEDTNTQLFTTTVLSEVNGVVDRINFSSGNAAIATVNPANDDVVPYESTITAVGLGTTDITAQARMVGAYRCSDSTTVTVVPPPEDCTITINPAYTLTAGTRTGIFPVVTTSHPVYTIDNVSFAVSDTNVALICQRGIGFCPAGSPSPYVDSVTPFRATLSAVSPGTINLTVTGTTGGGNNLYRYSCG